MTTVTRLIVSLGVMGAVTASASPFYTSNDPQSNTAEAVSVSTRFYELLKQGDSARAVQLLAQDALVLESGDLETRAEYIAHHVGADIEFAKTVPTHRTVIRSVREGATVWLSATSTSKGQFEGRQLDLRGAELMVLHKSAAGWRIRAIHWSSHRNQPQ